MDQGFHRLVGLAGIGRTEQRNEATRQPPRHLETSRVFGQVDAGPGQRSMAFFQRTFDRMGQPLPDPVEHELGRLRAVLARQCLQKYHRVQPGVLGLRFNLIHEYGHLPLQAVHGGRVHALAHQRELRISVHLAPLGRPGQHALAGHQFVRHTQQIGLHLARKTHENAALLLDQRSAGLAYVALGRRR